LLEWWERYRRPCLAIVAALFLASSIWWYLADRTNISPVEGTEPFVPAAIPAESEPAEMPDTADDQNAKRPESGQPGKEPESAWLIVDVKGKVKHPGVYRFEAGQRVADAIEKAGGPTAEADLEQVNLAQPLQDGAALIVPAKGSAKGSESLVPAGLQSAVPSALSGTPADSRVNLNTATKEELMKLPGIGEAKAEAILEHRKNKRSFRSPEELKQVSGIGEKMYERLKDHIRVQ